MRPGVRTATLDGYLGLARSVGLDPARILTNAGIAVADLAVPDKWVPAAAVSRVLERSANESGLEDFGLRLAGLRRLATLGPLSVVLSQEPDLRSALDLLCRYEHSYNEAIRLRLEEAGDLATMRLWFEFGEPAPTRQALELATATLLGHRPRAARPAVGTAVDLLHPPGTGIARRPPRGVRAPAAVRARVHRAGLLRHRARRRERGVRPAAPALRRPAAHGTRRSAGRDGDRAGDATGRDAAARRPVLDAPGGPEPGGDAADAAPPAGRRGAVVLGDRARRPGRRWPSATSRPTATR